MPSSVLPLHRYASDTNICFFIKISVFQRPTDAAFFPETIHPSHRFRSFTAVSLVISSHENEANLKVVPPLLRQDVFYQEKQDGNYIHGYMVNSGFSESVLKWHHTHPEVPLRFSGTAGARVQ